MSQPIAHHNFVPGSSRKPRNARTVLLRMAADQERADRIRALKRDHPEFTWQAVAERVGVSLRAAQSWQETGGIAYDNAKRLAELWGEDVDYIMRGERDGTPDPFAGESQLDRIEANQEEILRLLRLAVVTAPTGVEPLRREELGLPTEPDERAPDRRRRAS